MEYLIEAQFNSLLNRVWIPRQIEMIVVDSIEDIAVEDVIKNTLETIMRQEVPKIADEALEAEKDRQENEALENAFNEYIERCMMEG